MFSRVISYAAAAMVLGSSIAGAQDITLVPGTLAPANPLPNSIVTVPFSLTKDSDVEEQRLVFVAEMLRDGAVVDTQTMDNSGSGYEDDSGNFQFEFVVGAEGEYTFKIYAAPWSLNRWVVEEMESWPTDGTFTYRWSGGGYGVMESVIYLGTVIAPKPSGDTTYCSGAAFNVAVASYQDYQSNYGLQTVGTMSVSNMQRFRHLWYGTLVYPDPDLKLAALAIPEYNIGEEITDLDEVQRGDFVQLWRHSGSGHNPIFEEWIRDDEENIIGMKYWGSQSSTNGLGVRDEYFGDSWGIDVDQTYFGRIMKPRDEGDKDYALATAETDPITVAQPTPTVTPTPTRSPIAGNDTDRDGLSDAEEATLGTSSTDKDTDGDGVEDGVEVAIGWNPLQGPGFIFLDTDIDGVPDAHDPGMGSDIDGDGYKDFYELALGTDPEDPESIPALGDTDGSGRMDNVDAVRIMEYFLGIITEDPTNAEIWDVNRDGYIDNVDAILVFNFFLDNVEAVPTS